MKNILFLLLIFIATGCSNDESELSDSVYQQDPKNPGLPAYSELGYNTFGANYDRDVFSFSYNKIPLKITENGTELALIFEGNYGYKGEMTMKIILPSSKATTYQDLLIYDKKNIDLAAADVKIELIYNGTTEVITILDGELNFKRAQNIYLDRVKHGIILSGTFNFKFIANKTPLKMSNGRFDILVNNENFYYLK